MSSTGNLDVTGNSPQNYYCYECQHTVTLPTNSELCCPNCNSTFLEQSDTAPAPPPHHPITHNSNNPFENDLSALFGGVAFSGRSPNEFDPFAFLNDYLRAAAGDANIQLVFENNNEFGSGLPGNFGDYFLGPGLEQLIQQLAENDPNRSGPPPAAKSVVLGLPDVKECYSQYEKLRHFPNFLSQQFCQRDLLPHLIAGYNSNELDWYGILVQSHIPAVKVDSYFYPGLLK